MLGVVVVVLVVLAVLAVRACSINSCDKSK